MMNSREAAYLALLQNELSGEFLLSCLEKWKKEANPAQADFHLAQEIAYGTKRRLLTLEYIAKQICHKLPSKRKEKLLLLSALYQFYFMEKIPIYALVNETIHIAKKHCHSFFVKFLNAQLRKLPEIQVKLPEATSTERIALLHSYPVWFVKELINDYGKEMALKVLELGNLPGKLMVRLREDEGFNENSQPQMVIVKESGAIGAFGKDKRIYIQNATPAALLFKLKLSIQDPKTILDLCASPGGKSILLSEFFPKAKLFANDISEEKLKKIRENFEKYGITAHLSVGDGRNYPLNRKFDLVVIDAPCSNSGVLNKRPEARWRLGEEELSKLEETQLALLKRGKQLLAENGQIWFLTCSILKRENENLARRFAQEEGMEVVWEETILPNEQGWDGGYGVSLK